jgi:hypothetical protein
MPEFSFEDCLLKHYIRKEVWLPFCRERLHAIRKASPKNRRRLRYFTFCAVGALDVLLLDREKVIRRSNNKEFDTVFFFDKDRESVVETLKRIPGANGFPGDFAEIVLQATLADENLDLQIPTNERDTREVRQKQMERAQLGDFIGSFPFDVVNLDVEQYLYRPRERLPGVLTNAIRKILAWQRREGLDSQKRRFSIDEFVLMFTTQVGPKNLPAEYIAYLRDDCIQRNLNDHADLTDPFLNKSNGKTPAQFFADDFDGAFKLSVPKSLSELALEQDWFIDDSRGIQIYQFDREFAGGTYRMLHMVMSAKRQAPPMDQRAPGQKAAAALGSHKSTVVKLFSDEVTSVDEMVHGQKEAELRADLEELFKHRERYYSPAETGE